MQHVVQLTSLCSTSTRAEGLARTRLFGYELVIALPKVAAEAGAPLHAELSLVVPCMQLG